MSTTDVFISYSHATRAEARAIAEALRSIGYDVWIDEDIPAHRPYAEAIEEHVRAAKAVLVVWSAEAAQSMWVRSEADHARASGKLVQVSVDGCRVPMPFDQIECANLEGWSGDRGVSGWRKAVTSIAELAGPPGLKPEPASAGLTHRPKVSIAVWPFTTLSGDIEQDYFAEGMVEEITTALSRYASIFVVGSGSTRASKQQGLSLAEAAERLRVRYILDGSVRRAAGQVRIAVKLVDAEAGAHIWADRFEDTLSDVFALQDRVALAVAGILEPRLLVAEMQRAARRPTDNMDSYDLYLRAIPLVQSFVLADQAQAVALLNRAIALDPNYGQALGAAAFAHAYAHLNGPADEARQHHSAGLDLAHRALACAGEEPEVLAWVADALNSLQQDLATSIRLADRACNSNPGFAYAWMVSGILRTIAGETDTALEHFEVAQRLDPMSWIRANMLNWIAIARFQQARYREAIDLLREAQQLKSTYPTAQPMLAAAYAQAGEVAAAREALSGLRFSERKLEAWASFLFRNLEHRHRFVEGVKVARGS